MKRRYSMAITAALLAAICGGFWGCGLDDENSGPEAADPVLVTEPIALEFTNGEPGQFSITLRNDGEADLEVSNFTFSTVISSAYSKGENWPAGDVTLAYGETYEFSVNYQPAGDHQRGSVQMLSNDPNRPSASVSLNAE